MRVRRPFVVAPGEGSKAICGGTSCEGSKAICGGTR